jgi:uncharacterized OB-fold protein
MCDDDGEWWTCPGCGRTWHADTDRCKFCPEVTEAEEREAADREEERRGERLSGTMIVEEPDSAGEEDR